MRTRTQSMRTFFMKQAIEDHRNRHEHMMWFHIILAIIGPELFK